MDARIIDMPENTAPAAEDTTNEEKIENYPSFEEGQQILKNIIKEMGIEDEQADQMEDLAQLFTVLELPDKEFTLMSGILLSELEKALNDNNMKLIMAQSLLTNGMKMEDLNAMFYELSQELEKEFKDKYDEKRLQYIKSIFMLIINSINETEGIPKRYVHIPIEKYRKDAKIPTYAKVGDAGLDVYALEDYEIKPGETVLIPTGLKVAIPNGYELQVRPKSGRALKTKLRVANTPGTIDSGYRDEIGVIIENVEPPIKDIKAEPVFDGNGGIEYMNITSIEYGRSFFIGKGEKFAQLVLSEVPTAIFDEVEDISIYGESRGGGFGSSSIYDKNDPRYMSDVK